MKLKKYIDFSASKLKKLGEYKKVHNINEFAKLSREGLEYGKVERRVVIQEFDSGECVCFQYPGKESTWLNDTFNPTDMRPKLKKMDGTYLHDIAFYDYQEEFLWSYMKNKKSKPIMALAVEHFKMAYMLSHKKTKKPFYYEDINIKTGEIIATGFIEMELYLYQPNKQDLNKLKFAKEDLFGCELLPFLVYLDFIAQNEDCKYHYFAIKNDKKWDSNTGRRNMYFSQIAYIAVGLGIISPGEYARSMKGAKVTNEGTRKKETIHVLNFKRTTEIIKQCIKHKERLKASPNGDALFFINILLFNNIRT